VFPTTPAELPYAEPMPKELYGTFPEQFIAGSFPFDPAIKSLYEAKGPYNLAFYGDPAKPANCASPTSATFDWTHELDAATWNTPQFGSAIDFSARLIATRLEKLPNFNLDGDRGYAWQTWRAKDPADIELNNPVPVEETYDLS
jgi:hypothetical protein